MKKVWEIWFVGTRTKAWAEQVIQRIHMVYRKTIFILVPFAFLAFSIAIFVSEMKLISKYECGTHIGIIKEIKKDSVSTKGGITYRYIYCYVLDSSICYGKTNSGFLSSTTYKIGDSVIVCLDKKNMCDSMLEIDINNTILIGILMIIGSLFILSTVYVLQR